MARRKQNSQVAKFCNRDKFRRLRKFATCENFASCENFVTLQNFCCGLFLMFSASLSFWLLIYNAEFNSNSSCLDRLNNFGVNSLKKLQN